MIKKLLLILPCVLFSEESVYRNNLKNREFDKEVPLNFCSEQATIALGKAWGENEISGAKPTIGKTDSSSCFGIDLSSLSEAIGHSIVRHLEKLELDLDMEAVVRGMQKELSPLQEKSLPECIRKAQEEKIFQITESTLQHLDSFFNGDEIPEDEHCSFSAPDPAKRG